MNARPALDILNDVADAIGLQQLETIEGDLSSSHRKMLRVLNRVLRTLQGIEAWWFLRKEAQITTVAPYILGLVEITNGSTAVTGIDDPDVTGTAPPVWTEAMVGRVFSLVGDTLVYRIASVTSATTLVLASEYQGTTGTGDDAKSYTITQDRYELPDDFDRPITDWSSFLSNSHGFMEPLDPNAMLHRRRARGSFLEQGVPRFFTLWGTDDQEEHRLVILDPTPDAAYILDFPYQFNHPEIKYDSERVRFPLRYDALLIEAMLYLLRRDLDDDPRAQGMLMDYLRTRNESLSKIELGQQRKRISPSTKRRTLERARWGKGSRRYDYGEHFDRSEFHDI